MACRAWEVCFLPPVRKLSGAHSLNAKRIDVDGNVIDFVPIPIHRLTHMSHFMPHAPGCSGRLFRWLGLVEDRSQGLRNRKPETTGPIVPLL